MERLQICRLRPGGGVAYRSAGCQEGGRLFEPGEEYLDSSKRFWRVSLLEALKENISSIGYLYLEMFE